VQREERLVAEARERLEQLFERRTRTVAVKRDEIDAAFRIGPWTVLIEVKAAMGSAQIAQAAHQLRAYRDAHSPEALPLVVVPFMGPAGQQLCRELGVSWLDLSGNADIRGDDLLIHVEGHANKFKTRGRQSSVFAPKASRVVRVLLADLATPLTHRDLVERSGLGAGYVSRIVGAIEKAGYISRNTTNGTLKVRDPDLLLRDWRSAYQFEKHEIYRAHVAVSDDEDLLGLLGDRIGGLGIRYAATGLAAAWLLTSFVGFRIVTFFVERPLTEHETKALWLRWSDRGANTWLVVPNDEGVFYRADTMTGSIPCVHPVQAYLDLRAHPERATEAAEVVRRRYLSWSSE
jgi:hypothetical protein